MNKLAVFDFDSTLMDGETLEFFAREIGIEEIVIMTPTNQNENDNGMIIGEKKKAEFEIVEINETMIQSKIYLVRDQKVMLDFELAEIEIKQSLTRMKVKKRHLG